MKPWIRGYERSQAALRLADVERDPTLTRLHHKIAEDQTAACESDGTCGSLQPGTLRIWQTKDEYYQTSVGELKQLTADLNLKKKEFSDERIKLLAQANSDPDTGQLDRSIVDDLASINALAAANSTKARTVWWTSNFLMLFFIFVECIPVLTKAISPFDPYDAEISNGSTPLSWTRSLMHAGAMLTPASATEMSSH